MNTGIQDGESTYHGFQLRLITDGILQAYNLGWKLLTTLQNRVQPKILSTYESERWPVAQELINFDREYVQSWAKHATTCNKTATASASPISHGVNHNAITTTDTTLNGHNCNSIKLDNSKISLQGVYLRNMVYTTGILIRYPSSELVSTSSGSFKALKAGTWQDGLTPGMRLPDFQILNQSDAVPTRIHKVMKADGRFRVLVFTGDLTQEAQIARIHTLAEDLASKKSFVNLYKPASAEIDSRIEIITIHASPRTKVELLELPEVLHPWNKQLGWDYWKVYADDKDIQGEHGEAYQKCAIDKSRGNLVVVRPDGYVGMVAELSDLDSVNIYFSGFMVPVLCDGADTQH